MKDHPQQYSASFSCRLCGSTYLNLYYTQGNKGEFKFYKCYTCGLVNYDLTAGLDQGKYAESYPDPLDDNIKFNKTQTQTYRFIRKHFPVPGSMLDIGCGNGRLLYLAKREGWQVKGLELSPLLAESVKSRLNITVDTMDFLEYRHEERGCYDLVVLRHVLEHLPDAVLALNKINSLLRPDGYAVLEFPNIEALDLKVKRHLEKMGLIRRKYKINYRPGHCNEFSRKSFYYLASHTGFEIILWQTYSNKSMAALIQNIVKIGNKTRVLIRKKRY